MITRLIHFSVYNRGVVLLFTALLALAGVFAFRALPIDAVPDITNNQVQVNTVIAGLVPEEIERTITYPIETAMRGLAGVEQVRSITRFGLSQVTVVFKDGVDIYRARQMVGERLQGVSDDLPRGSDAKLGPISSGLGEIFQYTIDVAQPARDPEERLSQLMELKALQDWFIKPRLITVEGVAEVNSTGGFERQYFVQPDVRKMTEYGIHFDQLVAALERANKNVGGAYITQGKDQFLVQGIGLFRSAADIERVPVKQLDSFRVIRLGEIARVKLGRELRTGAATLNGEETVLGTVMMLLGENSRAVALRVKDKVERVRAELPPGFVMTTVYDRSDLVNATLKTVEHNLSFGAGLVILVLFILLGNLRAALITAVTIPLTLALTFLLMKPLGLSGNLMSLGALDFGLIVDGTVILVDNCVRYIHDLTRKYDRALTRAELQRAVFDAAVEVRVAAGFGEVVVLVVFLPIFALVGIEGKMFAPMAATFVIAVGCALVLSFSFAPALASFVLAVDAKDREPRLMQWLGRIYQPILHRTLLHPKSTLALAIGAIVGAGILFARQGSEFLPQLNEGSYAFHMIRPVNISLDESVEWQRRAERILKDFPEVATVFSRIGTSEVATDPMGVNISDTYVMLKDGGEKNPRLVERMLERLQKEMPEQEYLASQPIQMRFNELLEGTRADVAVKVFGPDLRRNMELAREIAKVAAGIRGAGDVEVDLAATSPVLRIEPLNAELARLGASTSDLLDTIAIALGGQRAGYLYEGERKFPIVVRLSEAERSDLARIRELPVGIGVNATVPLAKVASTEFAETFGSINREDSNRRSAVLINLRGRDTQSFVLEAQAVIARAVPMPPGYTLEWGGNFANLREAQLRLFVLTPLALVLVLLMIYAAFGNVLETLIIFVGVPFALVGGVISLVVSDLPFSISAGVGFIALSGIAVLNGVVLVNYFNQLRAQGLRGEELVRLGTGIRLRPVLMTALVAVFGFLPMMFSAGIGAEVQRPLASVVVGGIVSSTLLTLLVLPTLYLLLERRISLYRLKDGKG